MGFRTGLLNARGQITFIVALALSTGFIIYLETLDTEERVQGRVATELARQRNAPPSILPAIDARVRANLQKSEEAYASGSGLAANRAALLVSLASAVQLGILKPEDGLTRTQRVLADMERQTGEVTPVLVSALGAAAVAFPSLQDRIAGLASAP
ncbi:hypothetical protein [Microvirga sp. BSC39]|uniref:hypothetical protein n=1 Tax=Microvirga sp. BSC39 TaxID=1549810 RepID=UPI0004E926DB|nr:hypothetical protein [Microvirga sp. BSC39]KFG68598.1 hypothetical protein JH26_15685 [Microvirga sp. BSC39]